MPMLSPIHLDEFEPTHIWTQAQLIHMEYPYENETLKLPRTLGMIISWRVNFKLGDENQQAPLKDSLRVPVGPITRARSKKYFMG